MLTGDAASFPSPPGTYLVVPTFNRSGYLRQLLSSIHDMAPQPAGMVLVDNASTDDTPEILESFAARMPHGFATTVRLETNIGGSGGFSAGVDRALRLGAQWVWLMDDDVTVLPDALGRLGRWAERFQCVHGRRWDYDGTPYFWQTRFDDRLGIFYPRPGDVFAHENYFLTNCGTFEGMLIHRDVVSVIGLPDPRFFLTWDDAVYGWLAARQTPVAYVNEFVLRRMRPQRSISLGIRPLKDSNDLSRFYVMRNRGLVANYLAAHGRYHRYGFAVGTLLTFAKEVLRAVAVERRPGGVRVVLTGWQAGRRIIGDGAYGPMPPWREQ